MANTHIRTIFVASALSVVGTAVLTAPALAGATWFDVTCRFVAEDGYGGGGFDMEYYGTSNGIRGWAVATTSCNMGTRTAPWYGGTNNVPVIAQNSYRLYQGRFEQIGMSWLKHSFCAVSEPGCNSPQGNCQSTSCSTLGIGCADTYWAGLNADADAPRNEINAYTGEYIYPFGISPSGPSSIRGKLQMVDADYLGLDGALYFVEGQYVERLETEEADGTMQNNNASHRQVYFNSTSNASGGYETQHMVPAIQAWSNEAGAIVRALQTVEEDGGEARLNVGFLVTDNGDGTWHYEFAVHNQNSHRSIAKFSVPVPDCVNVTHIEFRDIHYHSGEETVISGTDWTPEHVDDRLTWTSVDEGSATNVIRWATMYNFRFDADVPPDDHSLELVSMDYWRDGPVGSIEFEAHIPMIECGCPGDLNGDLIVDVDDILTAIAGFGTDYDVNDILDVLSHFGQSC